MNRKLTVGENYSSEDLQICEKYMLCTAGEKTNRDADWSSITWIVDNRRLTRAFEAHIDFNQ